MSYDAREEMKKILDDRIDSLEQRLEAKIIPYTHKTIHDTVEDVLKKQEKIIKDTLIGYGFNASKPHQMQADLVYLRKMREGSEDLARLIKKSAIFIAIPALIYTFWDGLITNIIQHIFNGGSK